MTGAARRRPVPDQSGQPATPSASAPVPTEQPRLHHRIEQALAARLRTVAPLLLDGAEPAQIDPDPAADAARSLELLVDAVVAQPTNDRIWLLLTAVTAAYPTRDQVDQARRTVELSAGAPATIALLDSCLTAENGDPAAAIEVVVGGVIVDVDHTAQHDLHTGIQRVARSVMPHWDADRDVVPAAWAASRGSLRRLSATEKARVTAWSDRPATPDEPAEPAESRPARGAHRAGPLALRRRDGGGARRRRARPGGRHRGPLR